MPRDDFRKNISNFVTKLAWRWARMHSPLTETMGTERECNRNKDRDKDMYHACCYFAKLSRSV